jgi:putative PIN family toxin of toxin-antitoxin system
MKVIIDTNVLVSAAMRDKDPEAVILFIAWHPEFEWIVSPQILEEYKGVLQRDKFGFPEDLLQKWFDVIEKLTTMVEVEVNVEFSRDQKDAKFLECALTSNAEFFITGDTDFIEARKLVNTTILSVSLFKKIVCDVWSRKG